MMRTSELGRSALINFRALWFFLDPLVHHLQRGFADEWNVAGHHFVEDQSECVQISALVRGLAFHLLGRHVTGRAEKRSGSRHTDSAFFKRFR